MGWSIIRKATEEDYEALNKAARRFAARHEEIGRYMEWSGDSERTHWYGTVDNAVRSYERNDRYGDGKYIARLWLRCVARALGSKFAEGIAYGCVGAHED